MRRMWRKCDFEVRVDIFQEGGEWARKTSLGMRSEKQFYPSQLTKKYPLVLASHGV